jgi:branched-chain amino acid transport system substrate-binding protein
VAYEGVTGSYTKPFSKTDHEGIKSENTQMGFVKDGAVIGKPGLTPAVSPSAK